MKIHSIYDHNTREGGSKYVARSPPLRVSEAWKAKDLQLALAAQKAAKTLDFYRVYQQKQHQISKKTTTKTIPSRTQEK